MSGTGNPYEDAVFGTKGVAAAGNRPGQQYSSVAWTDFSGNFWLFGGGGGPRLLNTLWKYDVSTGLWTWMSGANTGNQPGTYGTKGIANPANTPGSRTNATGQRDVSGNLLLFGGLGWANSSQTDNQLLNNLWSYSPASGQWAWLSGDSTINSAGVYGSKGTPSAGNKPGAKYIPVSWIDPANNFWIFGGSGYAASSIYGFTNDLWKYALSGTAITGGINSFTAQKQSQAVILNWTSIQTQNIHSFSIERYNGIVTGYQSIGTVQAAASASFRYSFTDNTPLSGTNFYRIRQVDQTGSATYSSTAQVDLSQYATQFGIYQNPVQNILQLVIQLPVKQQIVLQIRDLNGRVLVQQEQTGNAGRASFTIPVDRLSKGTYLIQVQSESIKSTKTFIKQ